MLTRFTLAAASAAAAAAISVAKVGVSGDLIPDIIPCDDYESAIDTEVARINAELSEVKASNDAALEEDWTETISTSLGYLSQVPLAGATTLDMVKGYALKASAGEDVHGVFPVNKPTRAGNECTKAEAHAATTRLLTAKDTLDAQLRVKAWMEDADYRASCE